VSHLVAGERRDALQRADLIGDEILDFGSAHAVERPAAKTVNIAIAGMSANADAPCLG
jgi:hypothetical protein